MREDHSDKFPTALFVLALVCLVAWMARRFASDATKVNDHELRRAVRRGDYYAAHENS